jgi:hypothetical protein
MFDIPPPSADLLWALPAEATILAPDMAEPLQVAAGSRPRPPLDGDRGLHDGRDYIDDAITAGEHMFDIPPPSADLLWALPAETAILPPNMAEPHQVAVSLNPID